VYRDGCKRTQPLSTSKEGASSTGRLADPLAVLGPQERKIVEDLLARAGKPSGPPAAVRYKLPEERRSFTHKFSIGGHEGYITVGLYEDGTPGEIFVRMAKEGSVIAGLMDSFATAISLALQHGVPLAILCEKFRGTRFEPSGFTGNQEIPIATSIMDYLFRWLAMRFLQEEAHPAARAAQLDLPNVPVVVDPAAEGSGPTQILADGEPRNPAPANGGRNLGYGAASRTGWVQETDAPPCHECGTLMVRSGACHKCHNCGATSGCS
jgi:ribonucleoside-diphosphate reductase alpha chain